MDSRILSRIVTENSSHGPCPLNMLLELMIALRHLSSLWKRPRRSKGSHYQRLTAASTGSFCQVQQELRIKRLGVPSCSVHQHRGRASTCFAEAVSRQVKVIWKKSPLKTACGWHRCMLVQSIEDVDSYKKYSGVSLMQLLTHMCQMILWCDADFERFCYRIFVSRPLHPKEGYYAERFGFLLS